MEYILGEIDFRKIITKSLPLSYIVSKTVFTLLMRNLTYSERVVTNTQSKIQVGNLEDIILSLPENNILLSVECKVTKSSDIN